MRRSRPPVGITRRLLVVVTATGPEAQRSDHTPRCGPTFAPRNGRPPRTRCGTRCVRNTDALSCGEGDAPGGAGAGSRMGFSAGTRCSRQRRELRRGRHRRAPELDEVTLNTAWALHFEPSAFVVLACRSG